MSGLFHDTNCQNVMNITIISLRLSMCVQNENNVTNVKFGFKLWEITKFLYLMVFFWFYKLGKGQTVKLSCVIKDVEVGLLHCSPQKHLPHVAWDNELIFFSVL